MTVSILRIPVDGEGLPTFDLVRHPKQLECERDRTKKRLVLVYMRSGTGADTGVSRVHVDCIATGALAVILSSMLTIRLPMPTNSVGGTTRSESVGRARKQGGSSAPLGTPVVILGQGSYLHPL